MAQSAKKFNQKNAKECKWECRNFLFLFGLNKNSRWQFVVVGFQMKRRYRMIGTSTGMLLDSARVAVLHGGGTHFLLEEGQKIFV